MPVENNSSMKSKMVSINEDEIDRFLEDLNIIFNQANNIGHYCGAAGAGGAATSRTFYQLQID